MSLAPLLQVESYDCSSSGSHTGVDPSTSEEPKKGNMLGLFEESQSVISVISGFMGKQNSSEERSKSLTPHGPIAQSRGTLLPASLLSNQPHNKVAQIQGNDLQLNQEGASYILL